MWWQNDTAIRICSQTWCSTQIGFIFVCITLWSTGRVIVLLGVTGSTANRYLGEKIEDISKSYMDVWFSSIKRRPYFYLNQAKYLVTS